MANEPNNLTTDAVSPPAPPPKTRGETLFDLGVYGGINGVGTFIATIPLAYWSIYGGGAKHFDRASQYLEGTGMSAKSIKNALTTTALGLGGTVMLLPVRLAEGYRQPIVNALNKHFGEKHDQTATPLADPTQTWSSLILGRLTAWGAVFGGFKLMEYGSKAIGKPQALEHFEESFGQKLCNFLGKATHDAAGVETKAYRYGKLAALDVFATTAASLLLYSGSRFFAERRDYRHAVKEARANGTPVPPPPRDEAYMPATMPPAANAPQMTVMGEKSLSGQLAPAMSHAEMRA